MKTFFIHAKLLFVVLFMTSSNTIPECKAQEEIVFDTLNITRMEVQEDSNEKTPNFDIHIRLPYATQGADAATLNDSLLRLCFITDSCVVKAGVSFEEKVRANLDCFVKERETDYGFMCEDVPNPPKFAYQLDVDGELEPTSDSTLAYRLNLTTYLGGAHGTAITTVININKQTGKIYSLKDIMKPGYEKPLTDAIVRHVANDNSVGGLDELKEMGIFEMVDPYVAEFCICKADTQTFINNQYNIAPYSMGTIVASVAKSEVEDWLR